MNHIIAQGAPDSLIRKFQDHPELGVDLLAALKKIIESCELEHSDYYPPSYIAFRNAQAAIAAVEKVRTENIHDRPLAAKGLASYRCKNPSGFTMIGAKDHDDAMKEALRSDDNAKREDLEVWVGARYIKVYPPPR